MFYIHTKKCHLQNQPFPSPFFKGGDRVVFHIYIYTQKEQLKPNSKASTQDLEQSILFASVVNCAIISRVKDGKDALLN